MTLLSPLSLSRPAPLLAQQASLLGKVAPWCAGILIAAVGLGLMAWWLRRRMASQQDDQPLSMGFSLSDLREMHTRGELTDTEYEHAKGRMVARTRARLAGEPEPGTADSAAPAITLGDDKTDGRASEPAAELASGLASNPAPAADDGICWEDPSDATDLDDGLELGPDFAPDDGSDKSR